MKNLLVILAALPILSCGVLPHEDVAPITRDISLPENDVVSEVRLGEGMLESGRIVMVEGFRLQNDVPIFDGIVRSGEYHQNGVRGTNKVFEHSDGSGTGIVGASSGAPSEAKPYIDSETGYLCFLGYLSTSFCSDDVRPDVVQLEKYTADSFIQELIYTGKVGDRIRFTYREFMNRMARQAFTVDVEYDLSESNIISYQGATVEIISATNQSITYKVLEHFN